MRKLSLPLLVAVAAAVLAGCGSRDPAADVGGSLAQPSPTTSPPALAAPETTPRGTIPKQIGELAGYGPACTGPITECEVRFVIDEITVDPECSRQYAMASENGHLVAVRFNVETSPTFDPMMIPFAPNAYSLSIQGPDGFTDAGLSTDAAYVCMTEQEMLPPGDFAPASRYVGTVVLDSKYDRGILMFRPEGGGFGGWEWQIPPA